MVCLVVIIPVLQGCLDDDSPPPYNFQEQLEKDGKIIDAYLNKHNITATTHTTGLRYVIEEEGTGEVPEAGDLVTVHYKGTFLDGTVFDSSYDREEPIEFVLGAHGVIAGWEIAFSLLKEGTKATLYLPSGMAYGPSGQGKIGPNEVLVFEVELLEVGE